jgi:histidinol-phosphate aminotransferase
MNRKVDFSALANPSIQALVAYDPGHDVPGLRKAFESKGGLLELGSNENCYGPSALVFPALLSELPDLFRYPDPSGKVLKQSIANKHNVSINQIVLGNGSHELLMQIAQVFASANDEVLVSKYCFAVYPIASKAVGAQLVFTPANSPDDSMPLGHDLDAMLQNITPKTKLIFLANPNNPTGTWLSSEAMLNFIQQVPAHILVIVDEAYIEYVTDTALQSVVPLLAQFPNLIVTRTFSKAYGLAGIRAGFALANASVIELIERVRESFNLNSLALITANIALADEQHLQDVRYKNAQQRNWLREQLQAMQLTVLPSQTNFLLVYFGTQTAKLENLLFTNGVMVRPMQGYSLGDYLRITVATPEENFRFIKELKQGISCL